VIPVPEADPAGVDALFNAHNPPALDPAFADAQDSQAIADAELEDEPVKTDPIAALKRQRAVLSRQKTLFSQLPLIRIRRAARAAAVVLMVGGCAGLYWGRVQVVSYFPELAKIYDTVGLPVNLVGLEFSNVRTVRTSRNGAELMQVEAKIHGATNKRMPVPPVVVTLLDADNRPIYEWSANAEASDLGPGEIASLFAEVSAPPTGASKVRLTFARNNRKPTPPASDFTPVQAASPGLAAAQPDPAAASPLTGKPERH
jgi:hypothetical protein